MSRHRPGTDGARHLRLAEPPKTSAKGDPLFDIVKILGHSTLAVTMRYAHFAPKAGRSAIDRLGAALGGTREAPRRALA